jgi:D-alanine-D-alanine ligase-like ATP-grasp enzyme
MKKKSHGSLLAQIFCAVAPRIGASVLMEPEWGVVGQITFKNGAKRYFRYNSIDVNTLGASEISKDKDYAAFFMQHMGYPAVRGKAFFSPKWAKVIGSKRTVDAAIRYARSIGFPVIVKPNSQSQGVAVSLAHTEAELHRALAAVFKLDKVALVQEQLRGTDYRIVVLDDTVISAYERIPLCVVGDGRSTIAQLLAKKQREFRTNGRDTRLVLDDRRIAAKLKRAKRSLASVPLKGETVFLLDNANLSSGGDARDVTAAMHPEFKKLAITLTRDMGLRLCGVDLMIDGDIAHKPDRFAILEINSAPGLDHYATSGETQRQIVEDMYLEVLKHMGR